MGASERRAGVYAGLGAYLIWGLMPAYLKLLEGVSAVDVLAHRVVWSAAMMALACLAVRGWGRVRIALGDRKLLGWLFFSATMIGINWYIYTWAVLNGRVLDTSLGYFMQPLFNTALGVVLLREKLGRWQVAAVALALTGIVVMTLASGGLPLIALGLPVAFSLYSLARNRAAVDALTGLLIETALLAPLALWWVLATPPGIFGEPLPLTLLLIGSGLVTSVPLALFGHAARRLSLTALGFLQYVAPSCVFLLGVFAYDEPMGTARLAAFIFIWAGLAAFSIGGFRGRREAARG